MNIEEAAEGLEESPFAILEMLEECNSSRVCGRWSWLMGRGSRFWGGSSRLAGCFIFTFRGRLSSTPDPCLGPCGLKHFARRNRRRPPHIGNRDWHPWVSDRLGSHCFASVAPSYLAVVSTRNKKETSCALYMALRAKSMASMLPSALGRQETQFWKVW